MADNLEITEGVGTTVATDDIAGVNFQRVKLVDGTLDSTEAIPGTAANGLDVDVTRLPALPAGTNNIGDVDVLTIAAGDNNIGNVDVVTLPALVAGSANIGDVDVLTLPSIPAGTNNIGDVDVLSLPALAAGTNNIGDVDVLSIAAGTNNIGSVAPYAQPANFIRGATAAITNTTRTAVIAAQGASVKIYVTHILVTNGHASVGTLVTIEDGTTAIYRGYAAPVGGGFSITLPVPLVGTANTALNATCATTGSSVYVSASGYKGA